MAVVVAWLVGWLCTEWWVVQINRPGMHREKSTHLNCWKWNYKHCCCCTGSIVVSRHWSNGRDHFQNAFYSQANCAHIELSGKGWLWWVLFCGRTEREWLVRTIEQSSSMIIVLWRYGWFVVVVVPLNNYTINGMGWGHVLYWHGHALIIAIVGTTSPTRLLSPSATAVVLGPAVFCSPKPWQRIPILGMTRGEQAQYTNNTCD